MTILTGVHSHVFSPPSPWCVGERVEDGSWAVGRWWRLRFQPVTGDPGSLWCCFFHCEESLLFELTYLMRGHTNDSKYLNLSSSLPFV